MALHWIPLLILLTILLSTTEGLQCPEPPGLENGQVVSVNRIVRGHAQYTCNPGFVLEGRSFWKCFNHRGTMKWKARDPPRCVIQEVTCPDPGHPENGRRIGESFKWNDTLTFECSHGYKRIGSANRTCGFNEEWSGESVTCQEVEDVCEVPQPVYRGTWSYNAHPNWTTNEYFLYRDELTLTCDEGYEPRGPTHFQCGLRGYFEPFIWNIGCDRIKCLEPKIPESGRRIGNSFNMGDTVQFVCNSGYELLGSEQRSCGYNRKWSGFEVTCENHAQDCLVPIIPDGGWKSGSDYSLGSVIKLGCDEGNIQYGPTNRSCQADGTWSGEQVRCIGRLQFDSEDDMAKRFRAQVDELAEETWTSKINMKILRGRSLGTAIMNTNGMDIYFVFDGSGSIDEEEMAKHQEFAMFIVDMLGVSPAKKAGGTLYGAVLFEGNNQTILLRPVESKDMNKETIRQKLANITRSSRTGTNIKKALKTVAGMIALTKQVEVLKNREKSKSVVILFSDGLYNQGGDPKEAVAELQQFEVDIIAITVSDDHDSRIKLKEIASLPTEEHLYSLRNFSSFSYMLEKMKTNEINYTECGWAGRHGLSPGYVHAGNRAPKSAWPWMVGLYNMSNNGQYSLFCGGSLLDKTWVLTAAHCVLDEKLKPVNLRIRAGSIVNPGGKLLPNESDEYTGNTAEEVHVEHIYAYKGFNSKTYSGDIALLKLKNPVELKISVQTICLPPEEEDKRVKAPFGGFVAGWGHAEKSQAVYVPAPVKYLRHAIVKLQENQSCADIDRDFDPLRMVCAGTHQPNTSNPNEVEMADACKADSGGPLMVYITDPETREQRYYQKGIVSRGTHAGCGQPDTLGVYTRVSFYTDWIKEVMAGNFTIATDVKFKHD